MAAILAFLAGLALGRILNVVASRLPQPEEEIEAGPGLCPRCRSAFPWYGRLPLLGYLVLRGRCRACGLALPRRHPLLELAAGLLTLALWLKYPWSPLFLVYIPFVGALLALSAIDLEHRLLPDALTLPGLALGLALALVLPHLTFLEAVLGTLLGGGFFFLAGWTYERFTGKTGLGGGDVKMLAMIGAFLGVNSLPYVVFGSALLSALVGSVLLLARGGRRSGHWGEAHIPFGPFLAAGALLYLFAQGHLPKLF